MMGNEIFPDISVEQWQVSDDTIELPRAALIENSEGGLVRIVFVAFDRLESILKPIDNLAETKHTINAGRNFRVLCHQKCIIQLFLTLTLRSIVSEQFHPADKETYAEQ